MILKHIGNPKKSASKDTRINALGNYITNPESRKGTEKCTKWGALNLDAADKKAMLAEMTATAKASSRSKDPIDHWILSFREGENPDTDQVEKMVRMMLDDFGMSEHQAIYALHEDTDNQHIHIMLNRVHPLLNQTFQINNGLYKIQAQKTVAKLAHDFDFEAEDNDHFIVNELGEVEHFGREPDESGSNFTQKHAAKEKGEEVIAERAKKELTEIFETASSWPDLHKQLADLGYTYKKKGSGAVVGFDDVFIKASAASKKRNSSIKALEKKLGTFEPASENLTVSEKRIDKHQSVDEKGLAFTWDAYCIDKRNMKHRRLQAFSDLREAQRKEFSALTQSQKSDRKRQLSGSWKERGEALLALRSAIALEQLQVKERLKEKHKLEKKRLREQYPAIPLYKDWLRKKHGQDASDYYEKQMEAIIQLEEHRQEIQSQIFNLVAHNIIGQRIVAFRNKDSGKTVFYDSGDRITLKDPDDDESVKNWLQYCVQRYGTRFEFLSKNTEFMERCGRIAAENNLKIDASFATHDASFAFKSAYNTTQQERREQYQRNTQKPRKNRGLGM